MDGFHLADIELDRLGRRARKGAPDTFDVAGYAWLLSRVRQDRNEVVYAPAFERVLEQPVAGSIPIPPTARLVLTEGNYLLLGNGAWPRVSAELDECWYCDVPGEVRVNRLVGRHMQFGKPQEAAQSWVNKVDEANAAIVAATRQRADLILRLG